MGNFFHHASLPKWFHTFGRNDDRRAFYRMQNQTIRKHPRPMRTISMRRRAKVIFSLWVCGCSIIRQTAVSPPHERRNPSAAGSIWCNKRSARRLPRRPAIGGLNWAAAQFAVVIIPYRETAKAVFPPRQRRNPAAAGSIWCNKAQRAASAAPARHRRAELGRSPIRCGYYTMSGNR